MPNPRNSERLQWVNKRHKNSPIWCLKLEPQDLILIKDLKAVVYAGFDASAVRHVLSQRVGPIVPVLMDDNFAK
jgi:hypothetical protein